MKAKTSLFIRNPINLAIRIPAQDFSSTSPFDSAYISGPTGLIMDASDMELRRRLESLRNAPSPAAISLATSSASEQKVELSESLFDATAKAKILTSQVAMHLSVDWRSKLFKQLDSLHDIDEWDPDDKPLQQESYKTFLKAICQLKPGTRPGLGLSNSGYLIAAWTSKKNRLTIEFMPGSRVRWVISRFSEDGLEQFAGNTSVTKLQDGLRPHRPEEWFEIQ